MKENSILDFKTKLLSLEDLIIKEIISVRAPAADN